MSRFARAAALAACMLAAPAAWAQGTAPDSVGDAEIWLWRRATTSGKLADYQDYVRLYPDGRYVALAKMRVQAAGGTDAPAMPAPGPARPFALPPDMNIYHLDVTPAAAAQGQQVTLRTRGFPAPALFDLIVLVPAGVPDTTPAGGLDESQFRLKTLVTLYDFNTGVLIPPQPAGRYEVRYLSRAYNPEGRLEVVARSDIAWR